MITRKGKRIIRTGFSRMNVLMTLSRLLTGIHSAKHPENDPAGLISRTISQVFVSFMGLAVRLVGHAANNNERYIIVSADSRDRCPFHLTGYGAKVFLQFPDIRR